MQANGRADRIFCLRWRPSATRFSSFESKRRVENYIKSTWSELPLTILRPTYFMVSPSTRFWFAWRDPRPD